MAVTENFLIQKNVVTFKLKIEVEVDVITRVGFHTSYPTFGGNCWFLLSKKTVEQILRMLKNREFD